MPALRTHAAFAVLLSMVVAGCQSEPSFDERFSSSEKDIREKAEAMDKALADDLSEADVEEAEADARTSEQEF